MPEQESLKIHAFQRLSSRVTTSGRLSAEHIADLAAIGVQHIINLTPPDHPDGLSGEAEIVAGAGLGYTNIPVPFDAPDDAHYQRFKQELETVSDARVHVHCIMNWRVSAFFYRWHQDACGMEESAARSLMEQHWSPLTSDHPAARQWVRFCGMERD